MNKWDQFAVGYHNPLRCVITDVAGCQLSSEEREWLAHPAIAGVILFSRNFQSPEQIQRLIVEIRASCPSELLIMVDQEGGRVQRFTTGFTELPPIAEFGKMYQHDPKRACEESERYGYIMASELRSVGIDLSLAPVLDLDRGISAVIAQRGFAQDPAVVIVLAKAYMRGMARAGMGATGKHFPGHGGVVGDSHEVLPIDSRPFCEIQKADLQPFAALADQLWGVMPAHVCFPNVDSNPVGFSATWLQRILRQELGFSGQIISDDLSMQGAVGMGSYADRVRMALVAGCNLLLVCNNPQGRTEALQAVIDCVGCSAVDPALLR